MEMEVGTESGKKIVKQSWLRHPVLLNGNNNPKPNSNHMACRLFIQIRGKADLALTPATSTNKSWSNLRISVQHEWVMEL